MRPRMERGKRRDETLGFAATEDEKRQIFDAAEHLGLNTSEWMRRTLLQEAAKLMKREEVPA